LKTFPTGLYEGDFGYGSRDFGSLFIGSLALGAQHGKLDADLRTSALLRTPSVQPIHDYYPFAMEDGGLLASMVAELVDRLAILVFVRRFHGMGDADLRVILAL
jgi:hypothetical protein